MRPIGGLRGVGVWTGRAGAANANLRNGDRRVGLKAGVCSGCLAAMVGHARRVSRHVTVKIVTLHVRSYSLLYVCIHRELQGPGGC